MLGLTIPVSSVPIPPPENEKNFRYRGKSSRGSHALRVYFTPPCGQEFDRRASDEVRFDNRRLSRLLFNDPGSQIKLMPVGLPKPCSSHPRYEDGIRHGRRGLFLQNSHIIPSPSLQKQFSPRFTPKYLTQHALLYSLEPTRGRPLLSI